MAGREIVVIGGSAGALEALQTMVRALPADLPAAVFVALHAAPDSPGALPAILRRTTALPITQARPDEPIELQHIYIACLTLACLRSTVWQSISRWGLPQRDVQEMRSTVRTWPVRASCKSRD